MTTQEEHNNAMTAAWSAWKKSQDNGGCPSDNDHAMCRAYHEAMMRTVFAMSRFTITEYGGKAIWECWERRQLEGKYNTYEDSKRDLIYLIDQALYVKNQQIRSLIPSKDRAQVASKSSDSESSWDDYSDYSPEHNHARSAKITAYNSDYIDEFPKFGR